MAGVEIVGAAARHSIARAYMDLAEQANKWTGGPALMRTSPYAIKNPAPHEWSYYWSLPENLDRHTMEGMQVVTCERGKGFWGIAERELDKTNNVCRRLGCILMECPLETGINKKAYYVVKAIEESRSDLKAFYADPRTNAREVKSEKRLTDSRGQSQEDSREGRRRAGHMDPAELQKANGERLLRQIKIDAARQNKAGIKVATPETAAQLSSGTAGVETPEGFQRDLLFMQMRGALIDNDGVPEIVLSDDPNRPLDDFDQDFTL